MVKSKSSMTGKAQDPLMKETAGLPVNNATGAKIITYGNLLGLSSRGFKVSPEHPVMFQVSNMDALPGAVGKHLPFSAKIAEEVVSVDKLQLGRTYVQNGEAMVYVGLKHYAADGVTEARFIRKKTNQGGTMYRKIRVVNDVEDGWVLDWSIHRVLL